MNDRDQDKTSINDFSPFLFRTDRAILRDMGFTKKQRREQKKQHSAHINYKRRRKLPPRVPGEQPTDAEKQKPAMVLVKTSWTGAEDDSQEDFQLIELAVGKDAEQMRLEMLEQLRAQGKENCAVELFDPDNVPPGTIPAHARITPGQSPS